MRAFVPQWLLPVARRARLELNKYRTLAEAAVPRLRRARPGRPAFIVGCGRSGTTLLGRLLGDHPAAVYAEEPYHLWAAVDRRTDVTGLHFVNGPYRYFLDTSDVTAAARRRFDNLGRVGTATGRVWIEKMPHNVARIGWIEGLTEEARYINIVRNGRAVASSIGRIATHSTFKIAGKSSYNQWWGQDHRRWTALAAEGADLGYYPSEVGGLRSYEQQGAYEWLVSIKEGERWAGRLGDRIAMISYTDLTSKPGPTLSSLAAHVGLGAASPWPKSVVSRVRPEAEVTSTSLRLPPKMRDSFNACQDRFGFPGYAAAL